MGTQAISSKAIGAIKDSTTVNLAKFNSDYKEFGLEVEIGNTGYQLYYNENTSDGLHKGAYTRIGRPPPPKKDECMSNVEKSLITLLRGVAPQEDTEEICSALFGISFEEKVTEIFIKSLYIILAFILLSSDQAFGKFSKPMLSRKELEYSQKSNNWLPLPQWIKINGKAHNGMIPCTNAARASTSESGSKITISREAFESLSRKVEESEKLTGMKVGAAMAQIEVVGASEKDALRRSEATQGNRLIEIFH
ncbi:hypothetical protein Tco_0795189 [Tanacetum coccineum]